LVGEGSGSRVFNELLTPINDGMIVKIEEKLKFAHDRVQEAVYNLLDEKERTEIHYKLGRGLLEKVDASELEEKIFEIVRHLNLSRSLIPSDEEKLELARLNLIAGKKGKNAAAYEEARQFFKQGVALLPGDAWTRHYPAALELYTGMGEVCYLTGRDKEGEAFFNRVFQNYRSALDTVSIYETQISYYALSDRPVKALELTRESLELMRFEMPDAITDADIQEEIDSINRSMNGKEVESLEFHRELKDPRMIAAFRIIMTSAPAAYFADRDTFVHSMLKLTSISVVHGNSEYSPFAYAAYGIILAGKFEYFDLARRFGKLAVNLAGAHGAALKSKVHFINGYFIRHWKSHYRRTLKFLLDAFDAGVSSGDHQYASFGLEHYMIGLFLSGENLEEMGAQYEKYADGIKSLHMPASTAEYEFCRRTFASLCKGKEDPTYIEKLAADETEFFKEMKALGNKTYLGHYFIIKLVYLCLFGRFEEALAAARICEETQCLEALLGSKYSAEHNFHHSLALLDLCAGADEATRGAHLARVAENQEKMKRWARHAPMNFEHKYLLIEAEKKALEEETRESLGILKLFDKAIDSAERNGFTHVQGLALERAARFCRRQNLDSVAGFYLNQALLQYRKWGAALKVKKLEETFQELSPAVTATMTWTSTMAGTDSVDLTSVARASHAISGELAVKDLLGELINILIQNAGAKTAFLILEKDGALFIEARRKAGDKEAIVESTPLDESEELSQKVVKYVQRTRETVTLGDAARDRRFARDPYIDGASSRSILCFPLISQKKLKAIIYMENDLLNAFRKENLYIITLLSSQAAISLELFDKQRRVEASLQKKVMEKTRELRETQANLIQQAHVSGMAEMAVGILHNIGNAITPAIIGANLMLKQLDQSMTTLHLSQAMGQLDGVVRDAADITEREKRRLRQIMKLLPENIQMEYKGFRDQLQRILGKHEHIRNIIRLQMRYARIAGEFEEVDINRVVEDALEMLEEPIQNRGVVVRRNFTEPLPRVNMEQAKLIQVIVNILKNAYEAMEKINREERLLTITTSVDHDPSPHARLSVRDTGVGFSPEQKKELYKFAYSTKERGSGFGLHSCANYIIANKGTITAVSEGDGKGAEFILRLPISREE
ncbi:MAG: GAF domain-containing protein, partial [Desulfobacterales bacterium]|nr:GAF domain-containing protein [Desulfobacterales bacterium]